MALVPTNSVDGKCNYRTEYEFVYLKFFVGFSKCKQYIEKKVNNYSSTCL